MKLNIGCGNKILDGWVNIDKYKKDSRIVNADIYKLPFDNDSVNEIKLEYILEHIDDVYRALEELYRVTKSNGIIKITVPYCFSRFAFQDPSHRTFNWTLDTFGYFSKASMSGFRSHHELKNYKFDFKIRKIKKNYHKESKYFIKKALKMFTLEEIETHFVNVISSITVYLQPVK